MAKAEWGGGIAAVVVVELPRDCLRFPRFGTSLITIPAQAKPRFAKPQLALP